MSPILMIKKLVDLLRLKGISKVGNLRTPKIGLRKSSNYIHDYLRKISIDDIRLKKHLKALTDEFLRLREEVECGRKLSSNDQLLVCKLEPLNTLIQELENITNEIKDLDTLIGELKNQEGELLTVAVDEKQILKEKLEKYNFQLFDFIMPDDFVDDKDIIMELSAGVGGQEAMLFTKDMFEMYSNYFLWKNWNCELLKIDATDIGGVRNAHICVSGPKAFKILKFESGVHRVQRIPKTEKGGRMHTSTMTVAVLPQPSEIDIVLNKKDIEFEYKRSSAPGGQHVNKTDSCVRVTHIPTGIFSECQMERDQHKNKALALKALRTRLYNHELESIVSNTKLNRKLQVGTAGRSEKVRTYNFTQDRITDHRAHIQVFDVETFFQGREMLDQLLEKVQAWNSTQMLSDILNKYDST